jgi:hypothetical protein
MHLLPKLVQEPSQITLFNIKSFNSKILYRNNWFLAKNIESKGSNCIHWILYEVHNQWIFIVFTIVFNSFVRNCFLHIFFKSLSTKFHSFNQILWSVVLFVLSVFGIIYFPAISRRYLYIISPKMKNMEYGINYDFLYCFLLRRY